MRALLSLALGLARAALWPLYLILLAYAARVGPWPRSLGIVVSAVLTGLAPALLVLDLLRWLARPGGWPQRHLDVPPLVARQLGRAGRFAAVVAVVLLLPAYLFDHDLIAPEGRPLKAPALARMLLIGFELTIWATCLRMARGRSPCLEWLASPSALPPETLQVIAGESQPDRHATTRSRARAGLLWLGRRRAYSPVWSWRPSR